MKKNTHEYIKAHRGEIIIKYHNRLNDDIKNATELLRQLEFNVKLVKESILDNKRKLDKLRCSLTPAGIDPNMVDVKEPE